MKKRLHAATIIMFLLMLALAACNRATTPASQMTDKDGIGVGKTTPYSVPHDQNFLDKTHGEFFRNQAETCYTCHGSDLMGGSSKSSCTKCHGERPSPDGGSQPIGFHASVEGWAQQLHGQEFVKDEQNCKKCHGQDLKGGISKVSCLSCHSTFPSFHRPEGLQTNEELTARLTKTHGSEYLKHRQSCSACHITDQKELIAKDGKSSNKRSCFKCHQSYPHEAGFVQKEKHGSYINLLGTNGAELNYRKQYQKQKCSLCHGLSTAWEVIDIGGGESGAVQLPMPPPAKGSVGDRHPELYNNCSKCHLAMPHEEGWIDSHQETATYLAKTCTNCHQHFKAAEESPVALPVPTNGKTDCRSCHEDQSLKEKAKVLREFL